MNPEPKTQAILNKARTDKFILVLNLPKALKKYETHIKRTNELINLDRLQFSIIGAPTPTISIPHIELPYGGQTVKISSHARTAYSPITVKFGVDNTYTNWWVLWKWLDLINAAQEGVYRDPLSLQVNPPSQRIIGTLNDYATDITVFGYTEFDKKTIEFNYYGSFITELTEITYNYQAPEELSSTFTLQYSQFDSKLIDY